MKQYEVRFYPLNVIVKAENKEEAKEEAMKEIDSGELQYEVKEVKEIKEIK